MDVSTFYYKSLNEQPVVESLVRDFITINLMSPIRGAGGFGIITFSEGKPQVTVATNYKTKEKLWNYLVDKAKFQEILFFYWEEHSEKMKPPIIGGYSKNYNKNYIFIPTKIIPFNSEVLGEFHNTFHIETKFSNPIEEAESFMSKSNVIMNDFIFANESISKQMLIEGQVEFNVIELRRSTKQAKKIHFASSADNMAFFKTDSYISIISHPDASQYDGGFLGRIVSLNRTTEETYINKVRMSNNLQNKNSGKVPFDISFIKDYEKPADKKLFNPDKITPVKLFAQKNNEEILKEEKTSEMGFHDDDIIYNRERHSRFPRKVEPVDDIQSHEQIFTIL